MIAVHGVTLLGDAWLHPGVRGIAIPFSMGYRPAATGSGILARLPRRRPRPVLLRARAGSAPRRWRRLHRLTIAVYVLAVVHALGAGTDAATLRAPVLATTVPIGLLFARRLTRGRRRTPAASRPAVPVGEGAR